MSRVHSLLKRAREAAARRFTARGLILTYHRVAEGEQRADPWRLCVTPSNFATQLEVLRDLKVRLIPVSQLAGEVASDGVPRGTVAVSFDDGYRDNLLNARPVLERYEVPATLFATAGYIGKNEEFWWDVLERIFLQPGALPDVLELTIGGREHRWDLGSAARLSAADADRWLDWKPFREPPTMRHRLHDELWRILVDAPSDERDRLISALLHWAGLDPGARPGRRPLSEDELRQIARDDLVDVGAHSVTHPSLAELPPAAQAHELSASKSRLEQLLQRPVVGFSYPQGRSTLAVQQGVRRAGYRFACGSLSKAVTRRSDLYHLPRVSVGDWDSARFKSLLHRHMAS